MTRLTERIAQGPVLWLDSTRYAFALLRGEPATWLSTARATAWAKKAHALVPSDVVTLPVADVVTAWRARDGAVGTAIGATPRRAAAPLRALLADEHLRAHLAELSTALRAAFTRPLLSLSLPSPRRAIAWAQPEGAVDLVVDDEAVDDAASYLADFVRVLSRTGIDLLVLDEGAGSEPPSGPDVSLYRPLFNLGAHYGWDVGLRLRAASYPDADGPSFVIAPRAIGRAIQGRALDDAFWGGAPAPDAPPGGFRFAEIPERARPETVIERVVALRGC